MYVIASQESGGASSQAFEERPYFVLSLKVFAFEHSVSAAAVMSTRLRRP